MEKYQSKFISLSTCSRTSNMFRKISHLYLKAILVMLLIGIVCFLVTTGERESLSLTTVPTDSKEKEKQNEEEDPTYPQRKCYEYDTKRALNVTEKPWFLEDVLKATRQPQLGRTIFFHVTNCLNLYIEINDRQACAIESAAKLNPDWDIFVLFASPVAFSLYNMGKALRHLFIYPNIHWRNVDFWAYGQDTPAHEWVLNRNQLLKSSFLAVHLSDFIRLVSLYRYGGTHMDLDFITIKSIANLEPNYACAESETSVNNAVLNFDHNGIGHELVKKCLQDFDKHYSRYNWATNGPRIITRQLKRACNTKNTTEMTRSNCNFEVLPEQAFYAVNWSRWGILFDENCTSEVELMTKESFAVHLWNSSSKEVKIRIGSNKPAAYEKFAKEFCPRLYESLDTFL